MTYVFDFAWCAQESKHFREHYQEIAKLKNCAFLAAEDYTQTGSDGIHLTKESHRKLAEALYDKVKMLIG